MKVYVEVIHNFINLIIGMMWVVSFMPWLIYLQGKIPQSPLNSSFVSPIFGL